MGERFVARLQVDAETRPSADPARAETLARAIARMCADLAETLAALPTQYARAVFTGLAETVEDLRAASGRDALWPAEPVETEAQRRQRDLFAAAAERYRADRDRREPLGRAAAIDDDLTTDADRKREFARLWRTLTEADRRAFLARLGRAAA